MPISRVDYEIAATEKVKPAVVVRVPAPHEMAVTTAPPPTKDTTKDTGEDPFLPPDRALPVDKAEAPARLEQDDPQAPPKQLAENAVRPGRPGGQRHFKKRIDSALGRARDRTQSDGELEALLDQAVTHLETLASHPAVANYSSIKQRLDNVEQILNSSGNVR
jgi:hypothetical protein